MHLYEQGHGSYVACEIEILGFAHPELSAEALEAWRLPEPIQLAVRDHHSVSKVVPSGPFALSRVVAAANEFVNASGATILVKNGSDCVDGTLVEGLGMDADRLQKLLQEFREENNAMAAFFR
jgi:hypothetical protein